MSKASFNEAMTRAGFDDQTTKIGKDNLRVCLDELKTASSSSAVDAAFAWAGFNTSGYKISKAGVKRVLDALKTGYTCRSERYHCKNNDTATIGIYRNRSVWHVG